QLFARSDVSELGQNALVLRIQPDEGVTLRFGSKVPGASMEVRDVSMDFAYGQSFTEASPEAYERLILDVLIGDPPLFPRQEEVELSWRILAPVQQFWVKNAKLEQYVSGTWGPSSAEALLARDARQWRRPLPATRPRGDPDDALPSAHHHGADHRGAHGLAAQRGRWRHEHGVDPGHRHRRGRSLRCCACCDRGRP